MPNSSNFDQLVRVFGFGDFDLVLELEAELDAGGRGATADGDRAGAIEAVGLSLGEDGEVATRLGILQARAEAGGGGGGGRKSGKGQGNCDCDGPARIILYMAVVLLDRFRRVPNSV